MFSYQQKIKSDIINNSVVKINLKIREQTVEMFKKIHIFKYSFNYFKILNVEK